jgi:putative methionine-R-sulfoxide reductase with GAF domain
MQNTGTYNMHAGSQPQVFGTVPTAQKRERRCFTRLNLLVELRQAVFAELGSTRGLLLDVGTGGISVEAVHPIEKASTLSVSFLLPFQQESLQTKCEVVWRNGGRTGLRFVQLSTAEQQQLERWLDCYAEEPAASDNTRGGAPVRYAPQNTTTKYYDVNYDRVAVALNFGALRDLPKSDLTRTVEEARSLTGADGAAIALRDEEGVVCRASTGNAPSVGVRLRSESGLTGECLRTGELVWCEDMHNDSRVDEGVAQSLQSRSALILPIRPAIPKGSVLGVLLVLSSQSAAFDSEHVAILNNISKRIGCHCSSTEAPLEEQPLFSADSILELVSNSSLSNAAPPVESLPLYTEVEPDGAEDTIVSGANDSDQRLERTTVADVIRKILRLHGK